MKAKRIILISMFSAMIAVGAFIKIPIPFCPITLQILFVTLAGVLLGGRDGALSVAVYVALGLMGAPVFTEGSGISYVLHPTFGYLVGFIANAYVTGKICHNGAATFKRLFAGSIAGIIFAFAIGTAYNLCITFLYLKSTTAVLTVLLHCFLPFPLDVALCIFTAALGKRILPIIRKDEINGNAKTC